MVEFSFDGESTTDRIGDASLGTPSPRDINALRELPSSAKLVYKALEYDAPLTQGQLQDETLLAKGTIRRALRRLETANLVEKRRHLQDARKRVYARSSSVKD